MRGRRITKTREQRIADLQIAINRSGFTGREVLQIMLDWCLTVGEVEKHLDSLYLLARKQEPRRHDGGGA